MFRALLCPSLGARDYDVVYHFCRFFLGLLYVGGGVQLGWSGVRVVLLIGSTCFGHYYVHHQELATIMLITTLVVSFLVCCMLEFRCS